MWILFESKTYSCYIESLTGNNRHAKIEGCNCNAVLFYYSYFLVSKQRTSFVGQFLSTRILSYSKSGDFNMISN